MMEEERDDGGGRSVVVGLIDKATNSTRPEVDPRLLKAIKSVVRHSDSEIRLAGQTVMSLMKRDHAQVRYLTLLIIDELFMRSKLFRTLIVENLDQLLTLSVGFRRNMPLPAPASVASVLRKKAIEFLEKWNVSFGIHYRQIRLGFEYLKNTLRFQFPNLQANAARIEQERRERESKTNEILLNKFENLKANFSSIKDEIQLTIDEINECLDIVSTKDEILSLSHLDDDEMEEFRSSELRQIRLDSLKEGEKIKENSENKIVFDALRELYKLLVTKHLISVQEWISVLIRAEVSDNRFRDTAMKEFIDIRNHLLSAKNKCEESGFSLPDTKNPEEEDIWEEGIVESFEKTSTSEEKKPMDNLNAVSNPNSEKKKKKKKFLHASGETESDPLKSKLMAEAPVMKWGSFLDNWGSKEGFLANQRGLELENHWGRVEHDVVIPAEKIAELNVQTTLYREEPVELQPCRAPLRKGGFCQRRDMRVCPFHGPIVPRDDEGKPIEQNPLLSSDLETDFVENCPHSTEEIAEMAIKNVREREKDEARERQYEKKAAKRAKLAKVREHNEAVLKDAALASTSRSSAMGEDGASGRKKEQSLAAMLKKKVTAKDRLARKLLNSTVRDATIRQLTVGDDATYREAFPNQW